MSYEITDLGDVTLTQIDYDTETGPFWFVVVDDTPVSPDVPLPLELAIREFRNEVAEAEDGDVVELRQCTDVDLEWAGVNPGGRDGDGTGQDGAQANG